MTPTLISENRAEKRPGTRQENPRQTRARRELLESLPVRLADGLLQSAISLAGEGKSHRAIGWHLKLDPVVIGIELARARQRSNMRRPLTAEQQHDLDVEAGMPRLDALEWKRLAKGTHIPNVQVRDMLLAALAADPEMSKSALLHRAGYESTSHGQRQLGLMRVSGGRRWTQTIRPHDAARVIRSLGYDPVDVAGL